MNIKDVIDQTLKEVPQEVKEIEFDLGVDDKRGNLILSNLSQNRIKFSVVKNENTE